MAQLYTLLVFLTMITRDTLVAAWKEPYMAGTHGVLFLLTGDSHCAVETEAAVQALENLLIQVVLELILSTATLRVLVRCTRRNLHLEHFFPT